MIGNHPVYLRALEPDDLDLIFRWENSPALWEVGNIHAPLSRQLLYDYIDSYDADIFSRKQLRMIIVESDTGEPAGTLDITGYDPVNRRAEIGIMIDAARRGKGYAAEALRLAADYCRDRLGMCQLWCVVAEDNGPSLCVFENAGFATVGTLRSWLRRGKHYVDARMMQLLL